MLVALLNPFKDDESINRWGFDHKDSHDRIRTAIRTQGGPDLPDYTIYPLDPSDQGWLERHQQLHQDMNSALGLRSSDLSEVNFGDDRIKRAWIELHFFEHRDAEGKLGL